MTASTHSTRRNRSASARHSFWSFAGLLDKRERWFDWLRSSGSGAVARRSHLLIEQLESRELLSGFTAGDLAVARIGDGTATLTSASTKVFVDDYTTAGVLQAGATVALPTADAGTTHALTNAGTTATEALLQRSTDGYYLTLVGY